MKLDKVLTLEILSFVKDNSDDIFPIDVCDIVDSLPNYSEDLILEHISNLCKAKYLIKGQCASNMVITVKGLYPKGKNLINELSLKV